ncbi:DUF3558 domain-containing protein [Streptomyces sp. NPDC058642]|uniref:DUF3558 domain-containing protein n=1 Tax=Streptomyces sp. NPDC058642 TaxID=3346572 RepID=UPI00364E381C
MQRKAYVPGAAALLVALLAGCTSGSDDGGITDDANPGDAGTASAAAEPGRYRTLPEPCAAVGQSTLDALLPGIPQITDAKQREKAYEGEPTVTFDTDRKVGCRWKVESTDATDRLLVDLERVVSYDAASDDSEAEGVFAEKQQAADLPEPTDSESSTSDVSSDVSSESATPSSSPSSSSTSSSSSPSPSGTSPSATPSDLQPRLLDDVGDEAFLDDELSSAGSTARQRTVTVAFRTSNVIVTIVYEEQSATVGVVPDSEEMQDRAREVASRLADALAG